LHSALRHRCTPRCCSAWTFAGASVLAVPGGSNETSTQARSANGPRQKFRECDATNTQNDGHYEAYRHSADGKPPPAGVGPSGRLIHRRLARRAALHEHTQGPRFTLVPPPRGTRRGLTNVIKTSDQSRTCECDHFFPGATNTYPGTSAW